MTPAPRSADAIAELFRGAIQAGQLGDNERLPTVRQTARDFDLPFLGRVPMDPRVVMAGDSGVPYLSADEDTPAVKAFDTVVSAVEQRLPPGPVTVNPFAAGGCGCASGGCGTSFK